MHWFSPKSQRGVSGLFSGKQARNAYRHGVAFNQMDLKETLLILIF